MFQGGQHVIQANNTPIIVEGGRFLATSGLTSSHIDDVAQSGNPE